MGASCACSIVPQGLFERLGGEQTVAFTLGIFYDKIMKDERVNLFLDSG